MAFTNYVKTADDPTIYGNTDTGQFVAFQTPEQLAQAQGGTTADFKQVQTVGAINPENSVLYTDFLTQNQQPVDVSGTLPEADQNAEAMVAGTQATQKTLQDYINELTPSQPSEAQTQYDSILKDISGLLPDLGTKAQDQLTQEQNAGLPQLKQQLADINSQILTRSAEFEKLFTEQEGKPITMNSIIGRQAQVRKAQAAEIGLLQARALGLQGQVQAAQATVDRAIDLKYQTIQDQINVKLQQLDLITPILNKEEAIRAEALRRQYNDQQTQLDEQKQVVKDNINLGLSNGVTTRFYNYAGEIRNTLTGEAYATPEQFFKAAGVTSFQEAYDKGLVTDLGAVATEGTSKDTQIITAGGRSLLVDKQTGEVLQDFGSAYKGTTGGSGGGDEEIISDFNNDLKSFDTQIRNGNTRESIIAQLKSRYPQIEPSDIERAVYEAYPDSYVNRFNQ